MDEWEDLIPNGNLKADSKEFISISHDHIRFTAEFVRRVGITEGQFVKIRVSPSSFKIQFEFFKTETEKCLALTRPKDKKNTLQCSSTTLVAKYEWIRVLATQKIPKLRQFKPKSFGKNWIIETSPVFEQSCKRIEPIDIPSSARGIYRYSRSKSKEVVYIGKGEILKRLRSPERKKWDFDLIEYSVITDENEQFRWEDYWIKKYESENKKKPFYNNIGGKSSKK